MQLQTGMGGGFALGTWPGTAGTNANASPQGPTATQSGFGTTATAGAGGGTSDGKTTGFLTVATVSLVVLGWIWWSLPR